MIELEKTYLAKTIPADLQSFESKEIIDIYIPKELEHPTLRIRKNGDKYEMTKKEPIHGNDSSQQEEQTIILTKLEFDVLNKLDGKKTRKIRYNYNYHGQIAEIDIFQDDLAGLVLVDCEFSSVEDMEKFSMPDFCLAEVTQEKFLAGGMVCGKKYADLKKDLERFGYEKLI
jgi:CYTH domain-containing protein